MAGVACPWSALALIAALVFPVLGFLTFKERLPALLFATLLSLAGALLLPYLAWVSFATALCFATWRLNPTVL